MGSQMVHINLSSFVLDGVGACKFLVELIKYVLYIRNQLPCLYDQLRTDVNTWQKDNAPSSEGGGKKRKRLSGTEKKAIKLVAQAEELFNSIREAIESREIRVVSIIFGSTTISAKEIYKIYLPKYYQQTQHAPEKTVAQNVRKMLRELISASCFPDKELGPMKLIVAFQATRNDDETPGVAGFLPKQALKLKENKCNTVHILLDPNDTNNNIPQVEIIDNYIWYQARNQIQGFNGGLDIED